MGCAERGRSIFEGVLGNAPKRTDLWNVYIDQVCETCAAACKDPTFPRLRQPSVSLRPCTCCCCAHPVLRLFLPRHLLWQEVKSGDAARIRSLLSRATSLALPPKKMKGFFRCERHTSWPCPRYLLKQFGVHVVAVALNDPTACTPPYHRYTQALAGV
jgi:hypothetical protein